MRLSTALTLTLVALLLVSPVGVIGASSASATSSAPAAADSQPDGQLHPSLQSQQAPQPQPQPADPQQVFTIRLTADGNAEWTVESRYLLEDDDDVEDFRAFADAVTSGDRDIGYDRETFERFRSIAQDGVDRQMELTNASWDDPRIVNQSEMALETDGEIEPDDDVDGTGTNIDVGNDPKVGIISYSFTWTNFTEKDGNRIYLGDVFTSDDSTWFPRLVDSQRLVIERPPNYGYDDHDHSLTDGKLVWNGPHEFDTAEFSVTYLEGAPLPQTPDEGSSILSQATLGFGLLVLLVLVGAGGYFVASRSTTDSEANGGASGVESTGAETLTAGASTAGADATSEAAGAGAVAATGDGSGTNTGTGTETETTTTYDETDDDLPDDDVDLELLSDEERVHRLLRQNGGRMKQASIVKETGWSNAKVSQLLSKMDDDEEIEKLRIGRENLITHPEVDPTEID
ncbi:hypothetical protein OB955_13420 [Halobacteria archaeon AArc-m2/3/4]|uniref:Helix-turn-helix domain-containing protein n=1 Tax=Natronoglomus mannanivorans TaxID=2979990 RepID=A0ABT2QFN1_9EURY|nr:hypothetical protein [Halobacteria archaeon AArc-m2/3/4]